MITIRQTFVERDTLRNQGGASDTILFGTSPSDQTFNMPKVPMVSAIKLQQCETDLFADWVPGDTCTIFLCNTADANLIATALQFYADSQVSSAAP